MIGDDTVVAAEAETGEPKPIEIEREIDSLRGDLDELVDELDRRRHDALDWRLQLRKHARPIALVAFVLASGVLLTVGMARRRPPAPWSERLAMRLQGRSVGERAPSLAAQLGKTAVLGLASVAARHVAERAIAGREPSSSPSAKA